MNKAFTTIWKSVLIGIAYSVVLIICGMAVRLTNLSLLVTKIRVNFLSHETLDKLYVMVFPDGSMTIQRGGAYLNFGPFLDVVDFDQVLNTSQFDSAKHLHHSRGWGKDPDFGFPTVAQVREQLTEAGFQTLPGEHKLSDGRIVIQAKKTRSSDHVPAKF